MKEKSLSTYFKLAQEYYDGQVHRYHDEALGFYMACAAQAQGPILEPMCGSGRFFIPLVQAGYDIEGFDASHYMLAALRARCPQPLVWHQFIQDFQSLKRYALIFIPYGSWGLLAPCDADKSLKKMYNHLAPGGRFIVDIETIASVPTGLNQWHRDVCKRPADGSYVVLNSYLAYNSTTHYFNARCRYESIIDGGVDSIETEDFQQYLYEFDEFEKVAQQAGFTIINKYQDYQKTVAKDVRAPLLIYECIKE